MDSIQYYIRYFPHHELDVRIFTCSKLAKKFLINVEKDIVSIKIALSFLVNYWSMNTAYVLQFISVLIKYNFELPFLSMSLIYICNVNARTTRTCDNLNSTNMDSFTNWITLINTNWFAVKFINWLFQFVWWKREFKQPIYFCWISAYSQAV